MSWGEAWDLTSVLLQDPTSRVAVAVGGWEEPMSREAQILADIFDLTAGIHSGKRRPKPYPRPWDTDGRRKFGKTNRPTAEVVAILAARGHGTQKRDTRGRIHGPDGRYMKG